MPDNEIILKLEVEKIQGPNATDYRVHVNGSRKNKPNISKDYTVEEYLVIVQALANFSQYYLKNLNDTLVKNNKAEFTKF